jgi:hypothetical protein
MKFNGENLAEASIECSSIKSLEIVASTQRKSEDHVKKEI